jgi:hypothetical protein
VLPTDLLEMVAALFVEQHDEDKTASLHRDAVLARCCAPVLPEDGSETPFADDATAASATAAAAAPVAGGRAPGAAAGGDTRGEAGAGDELLAWVSAQEVSGGGSSEDGDGDDSSSSVGSSDRDSYSYS